MRASFGDGRWEGERERAELDEGAITASGRQLRSFGELASAGLASVATDGVGSELPTSQLGVRERGLLVRWDNRPFGLITLWTRKGRKLPVCLSVRS